MQSEESHGLGLEPKKVRLVAYNPLWPQLYEQAALRIRQAIGHLILGLEHIGSTAIPGLKAKPILDIMAGVESLEIAPECIKPLEAIGYEYAPLAGVPDDYVFGKETWRTYLLHVVEFEGANWRNNVTIQPLGLDCQIQAGAVTKRTWSGQRSRRIWRSAGSG